MDTGFLPVDAAPAAGEQWKIVCIGSLISQADPTIPVPIPKKESHPFTP